MITFRPTFPSFLDPIYDTPAAKAASERGYEVYCDRYFAYLGSSIYKSVHEAERAALLQAVYAMGLQMQLHARDLEWQAQTNSAIGESQ